MYQKISEIIDRILCGFCIFLIAAMTILVFLQVIFRYVLHSPLAWSEELARFMFVWVTFFGAVLAAKRGKNINVSAFTNIMPKVPKKICFLLSYIATIIVFAIMAYFIFINWTKLSMQLSPALLIPTSVLYAGPAVAFILLCIFYIAEIVHLFTGKEEE